MRDSVRDSHGYLTDPFYHYTPEIEIIIDLKEKKFTPDIQDDVKRYYSSIVSWFHKVLSKEGIPLDLIDKALLKITPHGKECIIEAQNRRFHSHINFN